MTKNVLQDMVPPNGGRSIRNVPLPKGRRETPTLMRDSGPVLPRPPKRSMKFSMPNFGGTKKVWWWIGGAVGILAIALVVMSFMSGARIEITPRVVKANFTDIFNGYKVDSVTSGKEPSNSLPFQVVTITKTGGKTVKANGEEEVQRKASGTIVIYNDAGTASQRLIKNTRFESPEGLIFRISDSVVVPGQKTVDGKKIPGSIEAVVYADDIGEKYNIGLTDFTIPGFKNDPKYKTMYARSKTPMSGGFVGMVKKVAEADRVVAETEIENALKAELIKSAKSQIPSSMIILSGLEKFSFAPADQSEPSGSSVKININGSITAVISDRIVLGQFLASQSSELKNIPVTLSNADSLVFALKDGSKFDPTRDQSMQFSIKGDLVFVGDIKNEELITALSGKQKTDLQTVKETFPAIDQMKISLLPPWVSKLPVMAKDFTIVVNKLEQ